MGDIADMMIEGYLDENGEYIDGKSPGYPRFSYSKEKGTKRTLPPISVLRKELKAMIKENKLTDPKNGEQKAREAMNKKYGHEWKYQ